MLTDSSNDELVWCSSSKRQEGSKLVEEDRERLDDSGGR